VGEEEQGGRILMPYDHVERAIQNHDWRLDRIEPRVKRLEQQRRNGGGLGGSGGGGPVRIGKALAGGLTARSGDSLGGGEVEFHSTAGGTLAATGDVAFVYSLDDEPVGEGKLVAVERDYDGSLIASRLECEDAE